MSGLRFPVTIHLPAGQSRPKAGHDVELFVSVGMPNAEAVLTACARNWSAYLAGYCDLLLDIDRLSFSHAVRGGEPVVLARTALLDPARD